MFRFSAGLTLPCFITYIGICADGYGASMKFPGLIIMLVPLSPIGEVKPFRYGDLTFPDTFIQRDISIGIVENTLLQLFLLCHFFQLCRSMVF